MQHNQTQLFSSFQYNQVTPEIIENLIELTKKFKGDLTVTLSIPTSTTTAVPELPLGLGAQADRNEQETRIKKSRELMVRMKQQCEESRISFTGMMSKRKKQVQTSTDIDMVILPKRFETIRLSSFFVGHNSLNYMRKRHVPVWLIPSQHLKLDSFYFFSLSPGITTVQNEFIEESKRRFNLPSPTCVKNKDSIIDILVAESESSCSVLEKPSLLLFSESCFYGIPLINKLYMKFLSFLKNSSHHIVMIPE